MNIKKADAKGRIMVGDEGEHYWTERKDDGTIVLHPLRVPEMPTLEGEALRAIYWEPSARRSQPERIYIHSVIGGNGAQSADWVANLANELRVPVVIDGSGMGGSLAQLLSDKVERGTLTRHRAARRGGVG